MNLNERILAIPKVTKKLDDIRQTRFDSDEDFIPRIPYYQYNVPYGELEKLLSEPLLSREWLEIDPVTAQAVTHGNGLDLFKRYIKSSEAVLNNGYSFLFVGANGSGKTMLALYLLTAFIEKGHSGYYIPWKEYMAEFNQAHFQDGGSHALLRHMYDCELLVIDELGKESKATDNVVGELEGLLKHRTANNRPTIVVTNLSFLAADEKAKIPSLHKRYGNSVTNLLMDKYRVFQFSSKGEFRAKTRQEWEI